MKMPIALSAEKAAKKHFLVFLFRFETFDDGLF